MSLDKQTSRNDRTRASVASRLAQLNTVDEPEPAASASDEGQASTRAPRNKLWIVPVAIVALIAAAYVAGGLYFSAHCLPSTTVDGEDVSGKTKSEIASSIESQVEDYALTVSGDGVELTLAGADIDLGYDGDAYAEDVMGRANPWAWPLAISQTRSYDLQKTVKYDREKVVSALAPYVEKSEAAAAEARKSASIAYDSASASFALKNGGDTRALDANLAAEKVCSSLDALQAAVTLGDECLNAGDDYSAAVAEANALLAAAPTLTLAGMSVCEVSADQIASWVQIGDDLNIEIDSDALTTWCRGDLSKACDTVGTSRTYTRADGKSVTVSGGTYGWNIDGAETATQIVDALKSGQKTTIEIPTLSQGAVYASGGADWGNRYIDVDLTEQHARMYDASGNLIWETDIVTGDSTKSYDTPTGVYTMNSNRASNNVELRGKIDPETNEPEYISYVDYWMPFIGNSYALHDASWRSRFGGTIYEGNGSHGCVNLPSDKAQELFNLCSVGDVVVVHN